MEYVPVYYNETEKAWCSAKITLRRDVFLVVKLEKPGKLVIRQEDSRGKMPRVPIKRHKDTKEFKLRMSVIPRYVNIQIFTSTKPEEIKYAYI